MEAIRNAIETAAGYLKHFARKAAFPEPAMTASGRWLALAKRNRLHPGTDRVTLCRWLPRRH
jgi:hypothetical protein